MLAAVVIGPISLLTGRSLNPNNNDGLTLTQLCQVTRFHDATRCTQSLTRIQLSLLPPSESSYEKAGIEDTLWSCLLRIAREGSQVFEIALDEAVESWKALLHVDDNARIVENVRVLLLPAQALDLRGPLGVSAPDVVPTEPLAGATTANVNIPAAEDQNDRDTLRRRTRDEVNSIMATNQGMDSVDEYVGAVETALEERLTELTIHVRGPSQPAEESHQEDEEEEAMVRDVVRPDINEFDAAYRPEPEDVDHDVIPPIFTDRGERLSIDIVPCTRSAQCPASNWIPDASTDSQRCTMTLPMEVFLPEVPDGSKEVLFSDAKSKLEFSWPSTKVSI